MSVPLVPGRGTGEWGWEDGIAFTSTHAGSPGVEHSRSRQLHRAPEPLSESRAGGARRVVSAAAWRICQVEGRWRPFHKLWLLIERGGEASHRRTRSSKALLWSLNEILQRGQHYLLVSLLNELQITASDHGMLGSSKMLEREILLSFKSPSTM